MEAEPRYQYENCVGCGEQTQVLRTQHIDFREYYIEGAGQLCKECWDKTYENM